jgi:hypothetical protein
VAAETLQNQRLEAVPFQNSNAESFSATSLAVGCILPPLRGYLTNTRKDIKPRLYEGRAW